LRGPIHDMTQLPPVDKVTAVENRQTWKIFKCGVHQVIVLVHPTDGGIRIKTWQNGITKRSGHGLLLSVENIVWQDQGNRGRIQWDAVQCSYFSIAPKKTLIF
jgi:hypothetical protein